MVIMYDLLKNQYSGKKVLITGHTGFKGAWLLKMLSILGANIKGIALEPRHDEDLYNLIDGDSLCESVILDIRRKSDLEREIIRFEPDYIFHLAAQPLVRKSYQIPSETFEVNAVGTAYVLDAVRLIEKKCQVVLITTDKVYYNNEWAYPYRENDRLGGFDPYSASKACAELVIDSYKNCFFHANKYEIHRKAIAVCRAGNVIGGGDWSEDRLMPDIARAIGNDIDVVIRNPNSIRPWQHVLEPLTGYLLLGQKLYGDPIFFSQAYNFGPFVEDVLTVREMVELAIKSWGKGNFRSNQTKDQLHEAGLLRLDISKAVAELKWKPKMNASQAVLLTIDWYKHFFLKRDEIAPYTENQINIFFKHE